MKINEVEKLTGLTKKAIRLYESRGLLEVTRTSNTYREYGDEQVEALKLIRLFRAAGVSLSDIKLWHDGVISAADIAKKRTAEIESENEANIEQLKICRKLSALPLEGYEFDFSSVFDESERETAVTEGHRIAVGVDIGTTTLSTAVVDLDGRQTLETFNLSGDGFIPSQIPSAKLQDPTAIFEKLKKLLDSVLGSYPTVSAIGITGQMHGILYCDKNGNAVSPLATWQDGRAGELTADGVTYCDEIFSLTGRKIFPGYGLATHYYDLKNSLVPKTAVSLCTVMDYIAIKLCGLSHPVTHITNAHSLGLFDPEKGCFDSESVQKLGIDEAMLPRVTSSNEIIGEYRSIPVAVAIGDNQASFFGAVADEENSVLANYGTGSQISFVSNKPLSSERIESRPYIGGKYLLCGSALCGGRAYAILEGFFRSFCRETFGDTKNRYDDLNKIAAEAFGNTSPLDVCTKFSGERANPDAKGSVSGISEDNFTPASLILGVLYGMARELFVMYGETGTNHKVLIASGNVARKNPTFCKILADVFGMKVTLTAGKEEAAFGTALFALLASGTAKSTDEVKGCIGY